MAVKCRTRQRLGKTEDWFIPDVWRLVNHEDHNYQSETQCIQSQVKIWIPDQHTGHSIFNNNSMIRLVVGAGGALTRWVQAEIRNSEILAVGETRKAIF